MELNRADNGKWIFTDNDVNKIALWAYEYYNQMECQGHHALASAAKEFADKTYDILKSIGYYKY